MEVGDSQLSTPKPRYGTLGFQPNSFRVTFTGLSPSLAGRSRPLQLSRLRYGWTLNPTFLASFLTDSVWTFPASLAATKGILVSFSSSPYYDASVQGVPSPLRSFVSPEGSTMRSLIRESSVLQLHALTRGISLLAAPFFSAQA